MQLPTGIVQIDGSSQMVGTANVQVMRTLPFSPQIRTHNMHIMPG